MPSVLQAASLAPGCTMKSTKAGESKTKLKINHWRSSPGPPELAGFYVDSVWARTYGIWARTVFIYVYEAPGIQPSRLWQPGSMGLVSLSRALVPR